MLGNTHTDTDTQTHTHRHTDTHTQTHRPSTVTLAAHARQGLIMLLKQFLEQGACSHTGSKRYAYYTLEPPRHFLFLFETPIIQTTGLTADPCAVIPKLPSQNYINIVSAQGYSDSMTSNLLAG